MQYDPNFAIHIPLNLYTYRMSSKLLLRQRNGPASYTVRIMSMSRPYVSAKIGTLYVYTVLIYHTLKSICWNSKFITIFRKTNTNLRDIILFVRGLLKLGAQAIPNCTHKIQRQENRPTHYNVNTTTREYCDCEKLGYDALRFWSVDFSRENSSKHYVRYKKLALFLNKLIYKLETYYKYRF